MSKSLRPWAASMVALAVCSGAHVAFAQNQNTPRPRAGAAAPTQPGRIPGSATESERSSRTTSSSTSGQSGSTDHLIVQWLKIGNEGEIALGNLASKKAQNDRVKDFAKMMVQDHGKYVQELVQAGERSGGAQPAGGSSGRATSPRKGGPGGGPGDDAPAAPAAAPAAAAPDAAPTAPSGRPGSGPGTAAGRFGGAAGTTSTTSSSGQSGGESEAIQLKEEIGKQCVENLTRELNNKQGKDFDHAYIGQQIAAHGDMLATLQVFQKHASGQLRDVIGKGIQTTQHHKQEAEKIMQELDAGGADSGQASSGQNRPAPATRPKQ